jgi:hypothetical protein
VAEMIEKAHTESEKGTFVPFRDMDELNYALQSKKHPGCTRGYGNRPWKHALKSTAGSYGKKRKHVSYSKTRYKKRCKSFCRLRGKICTSHFKGIYKNRCKNRWKHNYNNYNCASTTAIENDYNHYLIDDLKESKECRLVRPVLSILRTVAYGLARPFVEGTLFNSHLIPK